MTGATSLTGGNLDVTGELDLTGNSKITGTVGLSGNTAVTGTLDVTGNTVVTGSITATGFSVGANAVVGARGSAVANVATTNDPGDGTISALTFSATPTDTEVNALRDECEKLRDYAAELKTQVNALLAELRTHGLIAP